MTRNYKRIADYKYLDDEVVEITEEVNFNNFDSPYIVIDGESIKLKSGEY